MIWKLINGNHVMSLTPQLISYSLGVEKVEIERKLEVLSKNKLMRYNVIHDEWEIFKGSNLDVEKEIKKTNIRNKVSNSDLIRLLNKHNPYRYVFAENHNANNQITRFANLVFGIKNHVFDEFSDYRIKLVFADEKNNLKPSKLMTFILPFNFFDFNDLLLQINGLEYIKNNEYYKKEYPSIEADIEYIRNSVLKKLNVLYDSLFKSDIYLNGNKIVINSVTSLSKYLSNCFDKDYNMHPIVINDQINMFRVSSVQYGAMVKVVDSILNNRDSKDLSDIYIGSSPSDLIYKTIIENIEKIESNKIKILSIKRRLKEYLRKNPSGNLYDIIDLLNKKPYGIRPYVSLILALYFLKTQWRDMLLFMNETYIPSIKADDLVEYLINDSEKIKYSFSYFDNKNRTYLKQLEEIFSIENDLTQSKSLSVRVCSNMYNWYVSLPTVTQQGIDMSVSDNMFIRIIKSSHTNPTIAIQNLSKQFELEDIKLFKANIDNHFEKYLAKFERTVANKIGQKDLYSWANQFDAKTKKMNDLINGLLKGMDTFEIYSNKTDNLDLEKWTHSSFKVLKNMIFEDLMKLNQDVEVDTVIINGKEKYVQKVELSEKALTTYKNVVNLVNATSHYLTDSEIEKIILSLVDEYIS
jgi:hypothetical protein